MKLLKAQEKRTKQTKKQRQGQPCAPIDFILFQRVRSGLLEEALLMYLKLYKMSHGTYLLPEIPYRCVTHGRNLTDSLHFSSFLF